MAIYPKEATVPSMPRLALSFRHFGACAALLAGPTLAQAPDVYANQRCALIDTAGAEIRFDPITGETTGESSGSTSTRVSLTLKLQVGYKFRAHS
jgi:hypothetical protein